MMVAVIIYRKIAEQGTQAAEGLLQACCRVDLVPVCYDEKYHACSHLGRTCLHDFAPGQFNDAPRAGIVTKAVVPNDQDHGIDRVQFSAQNDIVS